MPTAYVERLYIAPADRWNVHKSSERVPPPCGVEVNYVQRLSFFEIRSAGGYAQKVIDHKANLWNWFLVNRRRRSHNSVSSDSSWDNINEDEANGT